MQLLGIKSETTLIKHEREGVIKPKMRLSNPKRYSSESIRKLLG